MKDVYITIYTKDKGKLELSKEEWQKFDSNSISLHREDGPAVKYTDGTFIWYVNDKLHREDGPAAVRRDRSKHWYIDGEAYSEEIFNQIIQEAKSLPLELRLTDPRWWVRELK